MKKSILLLGCSLMTIYGFSQSSISGPGVGHQRQAGRYVGWAPGNNSVAGPLEIRNDFNQPISFHTSGVQRMIITQQGRVGIGAQAPTTLLQVDGQPLITGDLFRTIGPGNLDNVWRMETPGIPIT